MKPPWCRFRKLITIRARRTISFFALFLTFSLFFISLSASGDSTTLTVTIGPAATCSNGTIESGEECDGTALNGESCTTQGFSGGGTLSCNANCTLNISQCSAGASVTFGGGIIWEKPKVAVPSFSSFSPYGAGSDILFIPDQTEGGFSGFSGTRSGYAEETNTQHDVPPIVQNPPERSADHSPAGNMSNNSRTKEGKSGMIFREWYGESHNVRQFILTIITFLSIFFLAYTVWRIHRSLLP